MPNLQISSTNIAAFIRADDFPSSTSLLVTFLLIYGIVTVVIALTSRSFPAMFAIWLLALVPSGILALVIANAFFA